MKLNIQLFAAEYSTSFDDINVSVENNTSSLRINISFTANNNQTYFYNRRLYCWVDNIEQSKLVSLDKGGKVTTSFTFDNLTHDNLGERRIDWEWYINTGTSALGTLNPTGYYDMITIPRASVPTFSSASVDLGNSVTITTNRVSNEFTHTLRYTIGNSNGTIATNVTDTTTWTPSINLANEIINATTGIATITCETYKGETLIGTKDVPLTLNVPSSVVPTVSIGTLTEADTTMISKNWGIFVQNKSKLNIPITAAGVYGSTISSIITTINGLNFEGATVTTSTLVTSGTNTISTTVTDTRGRTATTTKTYNVVAYSNPNIQIAQAQRCLSDGTLSDNGTYLLYDFKGTISPASNNNTALYRIGYKKTTDVNYTYVTLGTNYDIDISDQVSSFTISADYPYDIKFEATDEFTTSSINRNIDTGFDLLNFNASGKAMAIGKVSSATNNQELLEIDLATTIYKTITGTNYIGQWNSYTNDLSTKNTTSNDVLVLNGTTIQYAEILESGVDNGIYYEKRSDGIGICFGSVAITADQSRSAGGLSYYSGDALVNLPITYLDTTQMFGYSNVVIANMNNFCQSYVTIESTSQIKVLHTNTTSEARAVQYMVIGKWK